MPQDIQCLSYDELEVLCQEIRAFLVDRTSRHGGHLASSLGAVELTVALHRCYDLSRDRLVFDVGHQCYAHKVLTGRKAGFDTFRELGGMAGFPKPGESQYDAFVAGHASNSISVALGMARARTLSGGDYDVVALIGDGALSGGMVYEALSDAGTSGEPMVVLLNDNGMSISRSVGGLARLLARQRVKPGYLDFKRAYRSVMLHFPLLYNLLHRFKEWVKHLILPGTLFESLGFTYIGPVDGHDLRQLEIVLEWARELHRPVLVHAITQKGRGYGPAEQDPDVFHSVSRFDAFTGTQPPEQESFSGTFGDALTELAAQDEKILAITAAMTDGTGLQHFSHRYPNRLFDVGICEEHAVAMAAGMAKQGMHPVVAIYSTFLQRAYDMLIHDVSLQQLHVVFAVDRAGLVGLDGETHNGAFDVSYLCSVPNMAVMCPASFRELRDMLQLAMYRIKGPVAIRYPRGGEGEYKSSAAAEPAVFLRQGRDVSIVTYGTTVNAVLKAADLLSSAGVSVQVIKLNLINPLDEHKVLSGLRETGRVLVAEEVCAAGCVGERLLAAAQEQGVALHRARLLNLGSGVVQHGAVEQLLTKYGLDAAGIARAALELLTDSGEEA